MFSIVFSGLIDRSKSTQQKPIYSQQRLCFIPLSNMSEYDIHDFEYDNSDLGQMPKHFNLPKPKPIEGLDALVNRINAKQSYPKEDMRRLWVKKSAEREKALKQLRDIDQKLEYLISKRKFTTDLIKECESSLRKLDIAVMSDITTR